MIAYNSKIIRPEPGFEPIPRKKPLVIAAFYPPAPDMWFNDRQQFPDAPIMDERYAEARKNY